jgi:hypothetical protein
MLQRQGRVSYRALKRQFDLDDAAFEDLKEALLCLTRPQVGRSPLKPNAARVSSATNASSVNRQRTRSIRRGAFDSASVCTPSRKSWYDRARFSPVASNVGEQRRARPWSSQGGEPWRRKMRSPGMVECGSYTMTCCVCRRRGCPAREAARWTPAGVVCMLQKGHVPYAIDPALEEVTDRADETDDRESLADHG